VFGAETIEVEDPGYVHDLDAMAAAITPRTKEIFIANPNNPTGTMIEAAELARLHAGLRDDVLLVLDQAYTDYLDGPDPDGGLALARTAPNVVVTRTLSKIYGLGGLRVGWATGPAAIVAELNRVRAPFPISVPALAAAEAAIEDQDFVAECRARNRVQRTLLADAIARLGN
jgi:histidinol-phosphate aminotransferase